ncbi:MAG: hypothetical protein WED05_10075 [Candidatus Atabeyarchaeum deiterrae]
MTNKEDEIDALWRQVWGTPFPKRKRPRPRLPTNNPWEQNYDDKQDQRVD